MKICVYAISLNERKFIDRFYESCKDADLVLLADTGSTDGTQERARELGIVTYDISVKPWRFDTARNIALGLIPKDIDVCVSLDIDEIMMPGWREEIERVWHSGVSRLQYRYDWGQNHIFNATKVHSRYGYNWQSICHEMIFPDPRFIEVWMTTDFLLIKHLPDDTKSRSNYLPQLQANTKEQPYNARNAYYYARELWFNRQCTEAIAEFDRYLALPTATWYHERSAARRYMARCYQYLGDLNSALKQAKLAHNEAENLREPLVLMAEIAQKMGDWVTSYDSAIKALNIKERDYAYTCEKDVWSARTYDAAAIAAYYIGNKEQALEYGTLACELDPKDPRLAQNLIWYSK